MKTPEVAGGNSAMGPVPPDSSSISGPPARRFRPVRALGIALGALAICLVAVAVDLVRTRPSRAEAERLTTTLGLTDLALVNEARYLRHLSQADLHSAFQDHPLALEHFPAGAVIAPPAHLRPPANPAPPASDHAQLD